jgi:hypothetical protein
MESLSSNFVEQSHAGQNIGADFSIPPRRLIKTGDCV